MSEVQKGTKKNPCNIMKVEIILKQPMRLW